MFCPQCGSTQGDDLKFCKQCGANLRAVRFAVENPDSVERSDWGKTWVAEMFMSSEEAVRRQVELERLQGITPEVKRRNEIKAGIITASVSMGLMLVLSVIWEGIIISGRVSDIAAEILSRIWIVGVIPILIGAALIFNGMFVSKRRETKPDAEPELRGKPASEPDALLPPADTSELFPAGFSVTDATTKHLKEPIERG